MTTPGPYAALLGIVLEEQGGGLHAAMRFAPDLIGRPEPPRLHGGAVAGLLETIGMATARAVISDPAARLSLLTTSVDFMRGGQSSDTYAAAEIVKLGRRVVNLIATAWQEDRTRPIAQAHISILIAGTDG